MRPEALSASFSRWMALLNQLVETYKGDVEDFCGISREVCARYFRRPEQDPGLQTKADDSPVTLADREIERRIREAIESKYPSHGIIGEEYGTRNEGADLVWVLDPIDGTKSFISGVPLFGTLIALLREGQPELGAIYLPVQNDLFIGDNVMALQNGRAVRMREPPDLASAVLLTTDLMHSEQYRSLENLLSLSRRVSFTRTWGDAFGYSLLAGGLADIMVDAIMNPWDIMALIPVIRGAGGRISDWQGGDPVSGNSIVAAHPVLHGTVIDILNHSHRA